MVTADVADLIAIERINGYNTQFQTMIPPQQLNLLRNPITHKIKHTRLREILGEGPCTSLTGQVATITVPQHDVNRMAFAHILM